MRLLTNDEIADGLFDSDTVLALQKWIRELEAELENQKEKTNNYFALATDRFNDFVRVRKENQRLRDAADRVVFEAQADDWSCMPSIQACKNLAALLEGGEDDR